MTADRSERQERLFGKEGQRRLRGAHVLVCGVGGLGTFVVHELASLGVGGVTLVDFEFISNTNRNRYLCLWHSDEEGKLHKVDLGRRIVSGVDPTIIIREVRESIISAAGLSAIKGADYVVGCVDSAAARLFLIEACAAYRRTYLDLASDVIPGPPLSYGGHVICMTESGGCPLCHGELDVHEANRELETPEQRRTRKKIYGVDEADLDRSGPSVIPINGVVASAGMMELMALITGLRQPNSCLRYYGESGKTTVRARPENNQCWLCRGLWGAGVGAEVERYFKPVAT
jgi:hypothetical protein